MFRVRLVGAVVFSFAVSGTYAEQFSSSLTASSSTQPIPGYAFGAGILSPGKSSSGASLLSSQAAFDLAAPASLAASTQPLALAVRAGQLPLSASLSSADNSGSLTTLPLNDPMRWTEARRAVDSYLGGYGSHSPLEFTAPRPTPNLLVPSNGLYVAPQYLR